VGIGSWGTLRFLEQVALETLVVEVADRMMVAWVVVWVGSMVVERARIVLVEAARTEVGALGVDSQHRGLRPNGCARRTLEHYTCTDR
jgi:hypothetical protein